MHFESFIKSYVDDLQFVDSLEIDDEDEIVVEKYLNRKLHDLVWFKNQLDKSEIEGLELHGFASYFYKYFIDTHNRYEYRISSDDKQTIIGMDKIFIFGAKDNAVIVAELLESWNKRDYCFVTSNKPETQNIMGKPVVRFVDLVDKGEWNADKSIFIIATSPVYHAEIEELLSENGLHYCRIHI